MECANSEFPDQDLKQNLFNVDEKGNIVNYILSPPVFELQSEAAFIEMVIGIKTNKISQIQLKQIGLMKQINDKNTEMIETRPYVTLPEPYESLLK
jgi:hypothetical protein